eukprot:scaffold3662_cov24-Tisochrysis_lutea.AAC.1
MFAEALPFSGAAAGAGGGMWDRCFCLSKDVHPLHPSMLGCGIIMKRSVDLPARSDCYGISTFAAINKDKTDLRLQSVVNRTN